jgi:hypothetical protein
MAQGFISSILGSRRDQKKPTRRSLPERSHLRFDFPTKNKITKIYVPMLENCNLSEKQSSNLADFDLIGRSNTISAYLGSKARSFDLGFNITLLHLIDMAATEGLSRLFSIGKDKLEFLSSTQSIKNAVDANDPNAAINALGDSYKALQNSQVSYDNFSRIHRQYFNDPGIAFGAQVEQDITAKTFSDGLFDFADRANKRVAQGLKRDDDLINTYLFWIEVIRSSTKNNSLDSSQGPPIVRLTHGPMYNNVPCIVEDYSIEIVNEAGYVLSNLVPLQVKVKMSMKEVRGLTSGSTKGQLQDSDGNRGWEAILNGKGSMDPYNGLIRGDY